MSERPNYYDWVYEVTKLIPAGRVCTYGLIADYLALGSARMVGWALRHAHGQNIPAHRVVNRKGELTGRNHFNPPSRMKDLLEMENVVVQEDKVADLDRLIWNPSEHLKEADIDLS